MHFKTLSRSVRLLFVTMLLLGPGAAWAGDWPGWRGPTGQGHCDEKDLPLAWDAKTGKNILWKALLHGGVKKNPEFSSPGWSCPIVWGDRVFLTNAVWPGGLSEKERRKEVIPAHHVVCFRAGDGRELWDTVVPPGTCLVNDFYHGYTVPTPVTDGRRVFALFGSLVIAALDLDGKIVWRQELAHRDVDNGICASLVLFDDSVILSGIANPGLCALDKTTGKVKWQQMLAKGRPSNRYATPLLIPIVERPTLIHLAGGFQGIDPTNGAVLWSCRAQVSHASPLYGHGLVYADNGRGGQTGAAIDPTGAGDVTKTHIKWQNKVTCPAGSSGIIVGDYLYRACNAEVLRCWKMTTGELVYEERLPRISPSTSPIASADGRVYFAGSGTSYVIKAGPDFELLATNVLGENDSYASPAVSNGRIFIKGRNYLWCVGRK